jgi:pimeloyl-ACP methyl ester carboxylesterase
LLAEEPMLEPFLRGAIARARCKALLPIAAGCCFLPAAPSIGATLDRDCHIARFETPVICASLDVPRDYDRPDGATLTLTAVVIPASTGRPAPDPLLVLAGGPGQSASMLAGTLEPLLTNVRRARDVILFDVRGTGFSERLDCEIPWPPIATGGDGEPASSYEAARAATAECAHELGERALFHTDREVVEDIERFRIARGYAQIDLWGGSYGTRVAQHYLRAYGEHVRAVILDAVSPVSTSVLVTGAHTPDASLAKLFADCAADSACAAAFPDLPSKFEGLLDAARQSPITASVVDPVTSLAGRLSLDYFALTNTVRVALYARTTTELLPFAIDSAARGNFTPLVGILGAMTGDETVALGAQFSMLCAEDWRVARDAGAAARTGGFMRDGYYEIFTPTCETWPTAALPPAMLAPFSSNVPALAISGDSDPVTPPHLASRALEQFESSVHLVVRPGFHTNSANPCVARIIASFLADPATGGRDHACIEATPRLRFVTSPSS